MRHQKPISLWHSVLSIGVLRWSYVCAFSGSAGALYFLPRSGWGAVQPTAPTPLLILPAPIVLYTHTAEIAQCRVTEECCNQVKNIQYLQMHTREDRKCTHRYKNKGPDEGHYVCRLISCGYGSSDMWTMKNTITM